MIKRLLYLCTALVMFQCSIMEFHLSKSHIEDVEVEEQFKPYLEQLDSIYRENKIKIDYKKVSAIVHIDSLPPEKWHKGHTYEGMYNRITKIVYINPSQMDAFWAGKYDEKVLLVLAHEIAHSQGKMHSSDYCSIMYPNATYSLYLLNTTSVEELVTAIYLEDYPLLEE